MNPSAKIICDSVSPEGVRLTTMEVVMHRFVLSEFNTHRAFSRNSASSRAIPVVKQLRMLRETTAFPLVWPAEQPGMQGGDALEDDIAQEAQRVWESARDDAIGAVERLVGIGVHKSVANRLLEPFMWHVVVVSSCEWDNFFGLRCNELAQPEIRVAAEAMQSALGESRPGEVGYGEWHLPYVSEEELESIPLSDLCKISAARCARVSYLTHAGRRDLSEDIRLYDRLMSADPAHASPLEHVATPKSGRVLGNFFGWSQLRHAIDEAGV